MNEKLYRKTRARGLNFSHAAEVGVYLPESSNILGFIKDGIRVDLFEPNPDCIEKLNDYFKGNSNVRIFPYAIYAENGPIRLYRDGASTFVADLKSSPALANDRYRPAQGDIFCAEARVFSDFDDGTIDLLSIDTEGCEWYVLMHLKSRPLVISLETGWKKYRNPYFPQIENWMSENGYGKWYRDGSDTVYLRRDIKVNPLRKIFRFIKG
ncbi:MAG: FkbM family methyltransferase [Candidatus Krumholzibacteria bacterium]|nr:FkbM family methyltransferase [Candidatus Krumholzibacteria bacterium]